MHVHLNALAMEAIPLANAPDQPAIGQIEVFIAFRSIFTGANAETCGKRHIEAYLRDHEHLLAPAHRAILSYLGIKDLAQMLQDLLGAGMFASEKNLHLKGFTEAQRTAAVNRALGNGFNLNDNRQHPDLRGVIANPKIAEQGLCRISPALKPR